MRRRRHNPEDVPLILCDLDNPKRWHKKALRRPWKHRDRFHEAVDDINLERAMKRRKNPMRTRRNCDMTFLSQEQEDRIVSRIAAQRNPHGRSKHAVHRWWKGLSKQKRMSVAKSVLGRMNPRGSGKQRRERTMQKQYHKWTIRKHESDYGKGVESGGVWKASGIRGNFKRYMKHQKALNRRRGRNPKRDGTPTRGEKRAVKYVEHLRTIMAASENARLEFQRLTGAVAKVGSEIHKPIGPRALKHVAKAHAEAWESEHEGQLERELTHHTGQLSAPSVAAVVAEHPELKFITSQISDLDSAIEHFKGEIRDLPKDDLSEDDEARLQEEIAKLAHQKKKLRARLLEVAPATATNPRRRGRGRIRSHSLAAIRRAGAKCTQALRSLRSALRRAH